MPAAATPRYARVTTLTGGFDLIPTPPSIQAGDTLVAIIYTTGSLSNVDITGGSAWVPQADYIAAPGDLLSSIAYTQAAGATNPTNYAIELDTNDSGMVVLVHLRGASASNLVLAADTGFDAIPPFAVPCPAAPGVAAGGIEIRAVAGTTFQNGVIWQPLGYPLEDQDGGDDGLAGFVAVQTILSGGDLPLQEVHAVGEFVFEWQAWTIAVAAVDTTPPPPSVPGFTQGKGSALYRYTAHDLMTGQYRDDLYPRDVTYDKRIGEPGQFTGSLPVPNSRVAEAVRRVIPKDRTDLARGPGRIEIRIWRDGELWGRYWLTGVRKSRGRDGKFTIDLRASTLDAYWFSIRVRDTRTYSGDQVANVRSLLQHAQSRPGAFNSVAFQSGSSGVTRELTAKKDDGTTYGRAAQEFAKTSGGFESFIAETVGPSGVESTWKWGYPKLSGTKTHVYTDSPHGGEIAEYTVDVDALRGGTDWEARGGTPETDATEDRVPVYSNLVTTPHRAAGWPRIDHLIDDPKQSTSPAELDDLADYYASVAGGALWVRTVTVFLGKKPSLTMNSLGDNARLIISDVWHERIDGGAGLDITERIIGISVRPTQKGVGIEEAVLTLEAVEVP